MAPKKAQPLPKDVLEPSAPRTRQGRPARRLATPVIEGELEQEEDTTKRSAPATKKRGRPAKVAETQPLVPEESDTGLPPPKRHSRPANVANTQPLVSEESDIPPPKKHRKAAVKSKAQDVTSREPLPARVGRNNHPGQQKGVAAAPRRKPGEAAALRAEQARAADEVLKKKEVARQTLAVWNVAEEEEDMEMDVESTQRLSAYLKKGYRRRDPASGSEGESFDFDRMDLDSSDSESELEEESVKKSKVRWFPNYNKAARLTSACTQSRAGGAKKGKKAVRSEVEDLAERVRGGKKGKEVAMR